MQYEIISLLYRLFGVVGYLYELYRFLIVLATIVMLLNCFFGFKIQKFLITLGGILLGIVVGLLIGARADNESIALIAACVLAIVFGVLAYHLFKIGLFIHYTCLGTLFFAILIALSRKSFDGIGIAILPGLVVGVLALVIYKPFIILTTAISGGFSAGYLICLLLPLPGAFGTTATILGVVLSVLGAIVQFSMNKGKGKESLFGSDTGHLPDSGPTHSAEEPEPQAEAPSPVSDAGEVGSAGMTYDAEPPEPSKEAPPSVSDAAQADQPGAAYSAEKTETRAGALSSESDAGQEYSTEARAAVSQPDSSFGKSFRAALDRFVPEFKKLQTLQKVYYILAACAALCFLFCFRFKTFGLSILLLAGAGLLLWACLKKEPLPCLLISIALSVFALRFLVIDLQRITGSTFYQITFFIVVNRLVLYAAVALMWVFAYCKTGVTRILNRITMGMFAYLSLYATIKIFQVTTFRNFLFYLGEIAFFGVFIILAFMHDKETNAVPAPKTLGAGIAAAPYRAAVFPNRAGGASERSGPYTAPARTGTEPRTGAQGDQAKFLDFQAEPTADRSSEIVRMAYGAMNRNDDSWITLNTDAVLQWACKGGNGYFSAVVESIQGENKARVDKNRESMDLLCGAVAEFVTKGCNAYYGGGKSAFKGWIIERLFRQEGTGSTAAVLLFDYCLGADGKLYLVVSKRDSDEKPLVMKCVCYSPASVSEPFCSIYSAAISGVIGALDAIPVDRSDPRRNVLLHLDKDYYFNFPIRMNDKKAYPYSVMNGVIVRLCSLLDESGKNGCCRKYAWMRQFLYPKGVSPSNQADDGS